jgi:hypothetical protein
VGIDDFAAAAKAATREYRPPHDFKTGPALNGILFVFKTGIRWLQSVEKGGFGRLRPENPVSRMPGVRGASALWSFA